MEKRMDGSKSNRSGISLSFRRKLEKTIWSSVCVLGFFERRGDIRATCSTNIRFSRFPIMHLFPFFIVGRDPPFMFLELFVIFLIRIFLIVVPHDLRRRERRNYIYS